jgi:hypothetical protein
MFSFPTRKDSRGTITITARHSTPGSAKLANFLGSVMCALTMCVPIGYQFVKYVGWGYHFRGNQIATAIVVGIFFFIPGAIVCEITKPIFWLLVRPRTTVRISADRVVVAGIPYKRASAAIQFTNLFPLAIRLDDSEGRMTPVASMEETASLRMFYSSNAILITTFDSIAKAGRFALACNAAANELATTTPLSFRSVPVRGAIEGHFGKALME